MVELDNGLRFLANFRYNIKSDISANPVGDDISKFTDISNGSEESFDSKCDQTMVGIVQESGANDSMKAMKSTCFFAQ